MQIDQLKPNVIVTGPIFSEPVQVLIVTPMGASVKLIGQGLNTNQVHQLILNASQIVQLQATPDKEPFDGDSLHFRLGIEALRLGLAYEYDPFFALAIARVDPLPHQLEAVYNYFLKQPRIRFLLADDPGAGKTIMAGLLLKELKVRGLVKRTLIITPANLTFQWQRELKEKFREEFEVVRGDVLRANYGSNPWKEKHQVVTSVSWVSRIEDAKDSLLRSNTEAAGEGINLQFCWFMINYDIPWNPVRLEQRMGRIHRYGQDKDCFIFNFVSTNTREGRVLWKLFERIRAIEVDLDPERTGKVFNVLGDIFPANQLERMIRDMYAHNLTEDVIKNRIVEQVDTERFRQISDSALEGLAKRELNLAPIVGKAAEAKERRLVPEVIEDFFIQAAPIAGVHPKENAKGQKVYRIGRVPRTLWGIGNRLESSFGKLGHEYKKITFDKNILTNEPTLEWVTPGHPLFECVRDDVLARVQEDLRRGAIFYDLYRHQPARLDVFSAGISDGRGNKLHERLYVVQTELDGRMTVRQPTLFLDLVLASGSAELVATLPDDTALPNRDQVEQALIEQELNRFLVEIRTQRQKEVETISEHMEISLNTIIDKVQCQFAELVIQKESGSKEAGLDGRIKQSEDRLFELNARLEQRREELQQEGSCTITDIRHHGRAWVLPHPERTTPEIASIVSNEEIERIAVEAVIAYEEARGWKVVSVEKENRGFDLISRQPHPEDPETAIAVRFIEVKGRSTVGEVALTTNEYKTAERLKQDYWLYVVFNCASTPEVHPIEDPVRLGWEPLVKIEHYHVSAQKILTAQ